MSIEPIDPAERAAAEAALRTDARFDKCPALLFARIFAAGKWRRLEPGERLFSAGDETSPLLGVASGFIAFESVLAIHEMSLITMLPAPFWSVGRPQVQGRRRLVSAIARTPLMVLQVPQARIEALEAEDPAVKDFKALVTGLIFLETLEALTDALIPESRRRIVSTLLRIAGAKYRGDEPRAVPISQAELATITTMSRQTCGLVVRDLAREGLIDIGYRTIDLLAPARLRAILD